MELGLTGITITEHDNLSGTMVVNNLSRRYAELEKPFKVGIGNEIYLIEKFDPEDPTLLRQRYYHFVLNALDEQGFQCLKELSSRAWYRSEVVRGRRRVPTLISDLEEIIPKYRGHIIGSTACLGGYLPQEFLSSRFDQGKAFVEKMAALFGEENFYIELQPSRQSDQKIFNSLAIQEFWGKYKFIFTTDTHYLLEKDFPIHEAFLRSEQEEREVKEYYEYARLLSPNEVVEIFKEQNLSNEIIQEMIKNTNEIGNRIQIYDLRKTQEIPQKEVPHIDLLPTKEQLKQAEQFPYLKKWLEDTNDKTIYCRDYCFNNLIKKELWNETYLARLNEEVDVFYFQSEQLHSNMFSYFNLVQWVIDLSWQEDCAVGPSRGSGSGSLICHLMDIVQGDPIGLNLPFFRFAHKERVSPLDIDVDHQTSRRPRLFERIREDIGETNLLQVATFKTLTLKAAILLAGRGYRSKVYPKGLDVDNARYLSSLIEVKRGFVANLHQTLNGDETMGYNINHTFIKACEEYPGFLAIIKALEGIILNSSLHAAGVIFFLGDDHYLKHCSLMRSPNGDLCTCYDLGDIEAAGCYKMDMLVLKTLDYISTTFDLLQKDNLVEKDLTLKELYRKYIDPNKINYSDPRIWDTLQNKNPLNVFQWAEASGKKGIAVAKPNSLEDLTIVNGLIRLMTEEGEEDQLERFARIKKNPNSFQEELDEYDLPFWCQEALHKELDSYYGVCAMQESFMKLSMSVAGYSLKEADILRKIVAKKKMSEIENQHKFFYDKLEEKGIVGEEQKKYLWSLIIAPSLGYGFSVNHSKPYSAIGVQCLLFNDILFPKIYWETAGLLVDAGMVNEKNLNHAKIAKAVASIAQHGTKIVPININHSERIFTLNADTEEIYYGFGGIKGVKKKVIDSILKERPFLSLEDFISRTKSDITSTVALIRAGAFDEIDTKENLIAVLGGEKTRKTKLNGQNLLMLSRKDYWPKDNDSLILAQRVFNFNHHIKSNNYIIDEPAAEFLEDVLDYPHDGIGFSFDKDTWKYVYDLYMLPVKNYLKEHQEEMLEKVNAAELKEWIDNYFPHLETPAYGEIETMGYAFNEHPYKDIEGLVDFNSLSTTPPIAKIWNTPNGRVVPIYELEMIAGICIAKDKLHSTITLLTTTGPVDVKFRKEQFAHYDAQISAKGVDGKKHIIEKSWFNRGIGLIIHGMRQDDQFIPKVYKNSPMEHTCYKIVGIKDNLKFEIQKDRKKGVASDSTEEDE